jgi:hypothetical protein
MILTCNIHASKQCSKVRYHHPKLYIYNIYIHTHIDRERERGRRKRGVEKVSPHKPS